MSVDPMAGSFPWSSPYAFAENDVIRAIDLEGLEKFIVSLRAFIPQPVLENPAPSFVDPNQYFKGDNRLFYAADGSTGSSRNRAEQSVAFDFDNTSSSTLKNVANSTIGLKADKTFNESSEKGSAGTVTTNISKNTGNVQFNIDAGNKVAAKYNPVVPSINANIKVDITPLEDGSFDFSITAPDVDGFPAFELFVKDEDGNNFLIFNRNPIESGETPFSLFGDGEHSFEFKGNSKDFKIEGNSVSFDKQKSTKED